MFIYIYKLILNGNGAAPGVIHTGRFFVLIPLKWLEKLTGVKDKYI
jgi:hypothetical protein